MNFLFQFLCSLSIEETLALIFIFLFVSEYVSGKINKLHIHEKQDSISNLLVGLVSFSFDMLFSFLTFPLMQWIFLHLRISYFDNEGLFVFFFLFVLVDFSEYWFHRLSHRVNLLWSAHVVHHQSERFNMTVGFRTSLFVPLFNLPIYALFPLLGFDPEKVLLIIFIQGVCQLMVHTELVGKLGILEYILVTPSAHRVHHGSNAIYLDKNYGKFFIVWDRLFGTYEKETETVRYGLKTPMEKKTVAYSIFGPFQKLLKLLHCTMEKKEKVKIVFREPDFAAELIENADNCI